MCAMTQQGPSLVRLRQEVHPRGNMCSQERGGKGMENVNWALVVLWAGWIGLLAAAVGLYATYQLRKA